MTKTILVFGASGFVGRNLVDRLQAQPYHVIAVNHGGQAVPGAHETHAMAQLESIKIDAENTIVIHLAAFRYDSERFDLAQSDIILHNNALNSQILHFCAERGISELRLGSSIAVYPAGLDMMDDAIPVDNNLPPNENEAFYAWSKRYLEIMAALYQKKFGIHTIAFRLSNPYGPYDSINPNKAHVAPAFVMKALDDNPIFPIRGDASVERDFTYVGDVVEVIVQSLEWEGTSDTFNLCSGKTTTLQTLAETVLQIVGTDKRIEAGAAGAFGPSRRASTNARVKEAFQIEFASLADGMKPTIEWYKNEFCK